MTLSEVLAALETLGTAQNRKVYARHGVSGPMHGVSYANLKKLAKQSGVDHELALALWGTGNHDARILATKIADPVRCDAKLCEAWARDCDNSGVAAGVVEIVSQTTHARKLMQKWTKSPREWIGRVGWSLLAGIAMTEHDLKDDYFEPFLARIEGSIHSSPNRVRDAMNMALIAIGLRGGDLRKQALAVAKRIGKVEVDHGETDCKTPDAAEYIRRTEARRKARLVDAA